MSIATAIQNAQGKVANAYTAVSNKGGTLPATQDLSNLPTAITSIPSGGGSVNCVEKTVDANGKLVNSGASIINLNGVTDIGTHALMGAYFGVTFQANTSIDMSDITTISGSNACSDMFCLCHGLTSVDLSGLTTIGGGNACQNMFMICYGLTSMDLSSLTTVSGSNACSDMFSSCTGLTSVDLSALTTISGNSGCSHMFASCTGLTSADLSALATISGSGACMSMFQNCTGLTSIKLNALNTMSVHLASSFGQMFAGCTKLESVELGGLTASTFASAVNQIQYLFNNTTGSQATNGCTVHFPSNFDPADPNHTFDASTLTGYPTFGGDANYIHVAFDLPASE